MATLLSLGMVLPVHLADRASLGVYVHGLIATVPWLLPTAALLGGAGLLLCARSRWGPVSVLLQIVAAIFPMLVGYQLIGYGSTVSGGVALVAGLAVYLVAIKWFKGLQRKSREWVMIHVVFIVLVQGLLLAPSSTMARSMLIPAVVPAMLAADRGDCRP